MKSAKENMRGEKGWKNVETKHSHASTAAHKLVKGVTEKRVQADLNRRPAELQSAALPLSYTPNLGWKQRPSVCEGLMRCLICRPGRKRHL